HYRLPLSARIGALIHPHGLHSPGSAEFAHLDRVRALGVSVPEVVAAGERIGPWGALESYLIVAELSTSDPLHEAIPELSAQPEPARFESFKRSLIVRMADITATLHSACAFHKDLYLCHFYLERAAAQTMVPELHLIDLHRLGNHRLWADRWRWKDLG